MTKYVDSKVTINFSALSKIDDVCKEALAKTAEFVLDDLVSSGTIPFDVGTLQNESTYVETVNGTTMAIVSSTPYARRLYYHPEYKFKKDKNANAKAKWLDPYLNEKESLVQEAFEQFIGKKI